MVSLENSDDANLKSAVCCFRACQNLAFWNCEHYSLTNRAYAVTTRPLLLNAGRGISCTLAGVKTDSQNFARPSSGSGVNQGQIVGKTNGEGRGVTCRVVSQKKDK